MAKNKYKRYYKVFKKNTAQIAIIIPVLAVLFSFVREYFLFISSKGYYSFYNIDSRLMLPYGQANLFQDISITALFLLYWGYSIFAVKIFRLKKHYLWKMFLFLLIPFLINIIWFGKGRNDYGILILFSIIGILFHWISIFVLGFCLFVSFVRFIVEDNEKKKKDEREENTYIILAIVILLAAIIFTFASTYYSKYSMAKRIKNYGMVDLKNEKYAVIDENDEKLILQKCIPEDSKNTLVIYTNTYYCIDNNVPIVYKNFNAIEKKEYQE